jgi:hypothetical protein
MDKAIALRWRVMVTIGVLALSLLAAIWIVWRFG